MTLAVTDIEEVKPVSRVEVRRIFPAQVQDVWSDIHDGLAVACEESHDEVLLRDIKGCLESGKWGLILAADDEKCLGCAVIEWIPTARGRWLSIPFMYGTGSLKAFRMLFEYIERMAAASELSLGVKWISSSDRAPILAEWRGYESRFVEYIKEM